MGVNDRPTKFTSSSTASSAGTPGRRRTSVKGARGAASAGATASGFDVVAQHQEQRDRAQRRRSARTSSGCRPCRRAAPPASGPTAADRICAAWIASHGEAGVARAAATTWPWPRPRGPMPPKSPMPTRSAKSCQTSCADGGEQQQHHVRRRARAPPSASARSGRPGGPRRGASRPASSGATPIRMPAHSAARSSSSTPSCRT